MYNKFEAWRVPVGLDGQPVPAQEEEGPSHLLDVVRRVGVQDVAHLVIIVVMWCTPCNNSCQDGAHLVIIVCQRRAHLTTIVITLAHSWSELKSGWFTSGYPSNQGSAQLMIILFSVVHTCPLYVESGWCKPIYISNQFIVP